MHYLHDDIIYGISSYLSLFMPISVRTEKGPSLDCERQWWSASMGGEVLLIEENRRNITCLLANSCNKKNQSK